MNSEQAVEVNKLSVLIDPVPELIFEKQHVKPARLRATVQIEQGQIRHFELELLLKTPPQVHAFQGFLSQFEPVEAIQAMAYFPDLELRLIFESTPALIGFLEAKQLTELTAQTFQSDEAASLNILDPFYTFKQYESAPI